MCFRNMALRGISTTRIMPQMVMEWVYSTISQTHRQDDWCKYTIILKDCKKRTKQLIDKGTMNRSNKNVATENY